MKTTTKAEFIQEQRAAHWGALETLAYECGTPDADGLKLWRRLRQLENKANAAATAQCNGEQYQGQPFREEQDWEDFKGMITAKVGAVLGRVPEGFFVNGDPRGYALKIEREKLPAGLHQDWGRYGILAPEIN